MRKLISSLLVVAVSLSLVANLAWAQVPPSVLSDGLIALTDLPDGFKGVGPIAEPFLAADGVDSRGLLFEKPNTGPTGVSTTQIISAIARASDLSTASGLYQRTIQAAVTDGWTAASVPVLGDEATGLSIQSGTSGAATHKYLFRNGLILTSVAVSGPAPSVSMDQAVGMAILVSARVDRTLLAAGVTASGPAETVASVPVQAPVQAPAAAVVAVASPVPAQRAPVTEAVISQEVTFDAPTVTGEIKLGGFSGLLSMDNTGLHFAVITDRGPNVFFRNRNELVLAQPEYSPSIVMVNIEGDQLKASQSVPLRLAAGFTDPITKGREVTGVSTGSHDGPSFRMSGQRVPYDPNGVDSEGIARDPRDGSFWIGDEYGPSILHVLPDGTIIARVIPEGLSLAAPGQTIRALLPSAFTKRKANRGFEGIAVSPDGTRVFAILQSPLANPDKKAGEASRNHRIVALDTTGPEPTLQGIYLYQAELASSVGAPEQDDVKVGDMAAVSNTRVLVAERDSAEGGPHKMVYVIDFDKATNLKSRESFGGKSLEQSTDGDLKKAEVIPVKKEAIVNLAKLGFRTEKFEGLTIVDDTTLALVGDNDFGLEEADKEGKFALTAETSKLSIVRLPQPIR